MSADILPVRIEEKAGSILRVMNAGKKTHLFKRVEKQVLLLRLSVDLGEDEDQVLVEIAHRDVAQGVGSSGLDLFAGRPASEPLAGLSTLPGGLFSY